MDEKSQQNRQILRRPIRPIPQQAEKRERIKIWMGVCLIILALFIDGFQALLTAFGIGLVFGPIISVAAYFTFWIIFMILGVTFIKNPKKIAVVGGSAIIEFFLSFLPGFSAGVAAIVFITIAEDKSGLTLLSTLKK